MWKVTLALIATASLAFAAPAEEWVPFAQSGLFRDQGPLWIVPDMERDTVSGFTGRLLDGARQGDAKSMATLGRFFFIRGDSTRAAEWVGKAAEAGHPGAQLDFGKLHVLGQGVEADIVEAYKWVWLATWADAPGADASLAELSQKLAPWQILAGIRKAAAFQDANKNAKAAAAK